MMTNPQPFKYGRLRASHAPAPDTQTEGRRLGSHHRLTKRGPWILLVAILLGRCTSPPERGQPLPAEMAPIAAIPDIPNARQWGDQPPEDLQAWRHCPKATCSVVTG